MKDSTVRERYSGEVAEELLSRLIQENVPKERRLYTSQLVCWLMVSGFLYGAQTLSGSVRETFKEGSRRLMGNCRRKRDGKQSTNTGALSQARSNVPIEYFQEILLRLHEELRQHSPLWQGRRTYLIDGTTLTAEPTDRLRGEYPPMKNQFRESLFPLLYLTVAHDLHTGVAEEPEWGPMCGEEKDCEVEQTKRIFPRLPEGSVVVSDRGHGIFSVVQAARKSKLEVVYRMSDSRVGRLFRDRELKNGEDISFDWLPSKHDLKANPEVVNEPIPGRLIVWDTIQKEKKTRIYIFTTLKDISAVEIVKLYGRRWDIEGEIRDIKKIFTRENLNAKTPAVLERQIYSGIISYNIIRASMLAAALSHKIKDPKRLSFANAVQVIREYTFLIMRSETTKQRRAAFEEMLYWIAVRENKPRPGRSFPRTVIRRSQTYPQKQTPKDNGTI